MSQPGDLVGKIPFSTVGLAVDAFAFDPAGTVALVADTGSGQLSAWDLQSDTLRWTWKVPAGTLVSGGSFSPDSLSMAVIRGNIFEPELLVLDMTPPPTSGPPVTPPQPQRYQITGIGLAYPTFSPDGRLLAYFDGVVPAPRSPPATAPPPAVNVVSAATGPPLQHPRMQLLSPPTSVMVGMFGSPGPMSFSPDSALLGFRDGTTIRLYDTAQKCLLDTITAQAELPTWTWTDDSSCVVTVASGPGWPKVIYTNIGTGEPVSTVELVFTDAAPTNEPFSLVFTRGATRVSIVGRSKMSVFDLPVPAVDNIQVQPNFTLPTPTHITFSPGGRYASYMSTAEPSGQDQWGLLDAANGDQLHVSAAVPSGATFPAVFSADGGYVAVWGPRQTQTFDSAWILAANDPYQPVLPGFIATLNAKPGWADRIAAIGVCGGTDPVVAVATNPALPGAAATTSDPTDSPRPTLRLLHPDGTERRSVTVSDTITPMVCAPNDTWVAIGAGTKLEVMHPDASRDWFAPHVGAVVDIATSASGDVIVTASKNVAKLFAADPASGQDLDNVQPLWSTPVTLTSPLIFHIALSADGSYLVIGCADGAVGVYENTGQSTDQHPRLYTLTSTPNSMVRTLCFGGPTVCAAGFSDGNAIVFDASTGQQLNAYAHPTQLQSVRMNDEGTQLITLTAQPDAQLRVWTVSADPAAAEAPAVGPIGYHGPITAVALCPDKPMVAAALDNAGVAIVNIAAERNQMRLPFEQPVGSVGFSPIGDLLVAASDNILHIYGVT